jgi:predicted esterase
MLSACSFNRPLKVLLQLSLLSLSSSLHSYQNMISTRGKNPHVHIQHFILHPNDLLGDGHGGRGIIFTPKSGSYSNVVYWFHGLGDTAEGWSDMMPQLGIDNTKFVLPTAPTRPISLNGGYPMPGWSDIYGLDETSAEDQAGFDLSADRVNKMIQAEVDGGINPSHIIVAGFSQGGALAYHIALRSPHKLGGCIGLSTWLPLRNSYPQSLSESAKSLPMLHVSYMHLSLCMPSTSLSSHMRHSCMAHRIKLCHIHGDNIAIRWRKN